MKNCSEYINEALKIGASNNVKELERKGKPGKMSDQAKSQAYDKMRAWHEGRRKQNLKNCSDEKLKFNYEVCKNLKYTNEMEQIKKELYNRGIEIPDED